MSIVHRGMSCGCNAPYDGYVCQWHQARSIAAPVEAMWCAVCCYERARTPGGWITRPAETQVGMLWACGEHVVKALEMQDAPHHWSRGRTMHEPKEDE